MARRQHMGVVWVLLVLLDSLSVVAQDLDGTSVTTSIPAECVSSCNSIAGTLETCTALTCLCTSGNNDALLGCMNCLYSVGPASQTYEAAQDTLWDFAAICQDFDLTMQNVTTTGTPITTGSQTITAAPSPGHGSSSLPSQTISGTAPATTSRAPRPPQKCYLARPNQRVFSLPSGSTSTTSSALPASPSSTSSAPLQTSSAVQRRESQKCRLARPKQGANLTRRSTASSLRRAIQAVVELVGT